MQPVAFDTETHLIGPQKLAPPLVCFTAAMSDEDYAIGVNADRDGLREMILAVFEDEGLLKIGQNSPYDLCVIANAFPEMMPLLFREVQQGRVVDVRIREKLINLAYNGRLSSYVNEDGVRIEISYRLMDMVYSHLGIDLSDKKEGDDIWRLNYHKLDGVPLEKWPDEAVSYAVEDSIYTLGVFNSQEQIREEAIRAVDIDPFKVQEFRTYVDFSLRLTSCWGIAIDAEVKEVVKKEVQDLLAPENLNLLIEKKIITPAQPPKPYKNGAKNEDGSPKMTKGKKEKVNKKNLKEYILSIAEDRGIELKYTAPSEKYPEGSLSVDSDWLEDNWHKDDVLEQYRYRQNVQKLVNTEIPRLEWPKDSGETAKVIHPNYDVLKETGRTSSYGNNKNDKNPIYPAVNIQNVDPRIRRCYIPREGFVMCSNDYSGMELGTLAQTCINLFGYSELADLINAGGDAHAYLGAQLAYSLDAEFRQVCDEGGAKTKSQIYDNFLLLNTDDDEELKGFFKHYRTFAKPTGLGYPGGLGPETFCAYAKGTYGVEVDPITAAHLKEVWLETYPEMVEYFNYINNQCQDPYHEDAYSYTSPLGMYRSNCSYCAASNGLGLQTPSAEGSLLGFANTVRACYDKTVGSILYSDSKGIAVRPLGFIHDEILSEIREDEQTHERAYEIGRIMVDAMKTITPDVTPKAEPALMRRWDKGAETVLDANGRLVVWEPKE